MTLTLSPPSMLPELGRSSFGLRLRRESGTVQGHGSRHPPGPSAVVRALLPRTRESRPCAAVALRASPGGSPFATSSQCRVPVVGVAWSQARTKHATFGSLSGSRSRVRRAACQPGASGRDGHVTDRYIVRRPLRRVAVVMLGSLPQERGPASKVARSKRASALRLCGCRQGR